MPDMAPPEGGTAATIDCQGLELVKYDFSWGLGSSSVQGKRIVFHESFFLEGIEYFCYDSVYIHKEGEPEPYIGKIMKIWEDRAESRNKMKVLWFFRPVEIPKWLEDESNPAYKEIFLASGQGKGVINTNTLDVIVGKCRVLCTSMDKKNPQPSEEDLEGADYFFYRTFDVGKYTISEDLNDDVKKFGVEAIFNRRDAVKSIAGPFVNQKTNGANVAQPKYIISNGTPALEPQKEITVLDTPKEDVKKDEREHGEMLSKKEKLTVENGVRDKRRVEEAAINEKETSKEELIKEEKKSSKRPKVCIDTPENRDIEIGFRMENLENVAKNEHFDKEVLKSENRSTKKAKLSDNSSKASEELTRPVPQAMDIKKETNLGHEIYQPTKRPQVGRENARVEEVEISEKGTSKEDSSKEGKNSSKKTKLMVDSNEDQDVASGLRMDGLEDAVKKTSGCKKVVLSSENISVKKTKLIDNSSRTSEGLTHLLSEAKSVKKERIPGHKIINVTKRPEVESNKWFKGLPWDERLQRGYDQGSVVLLENFDPSYTSAEVEAVLAVDNRENVGMAMLSYLEMTTQADRDVLQRCGLYKALRTPQYTSDQRLLVDIVSHWDRRRHVFHLPQVGDVTVTPRDIRRILGVPATGMPVRLGTLPSTEAAHREAAQFFTGAGRWDRRGAPLQTVLLSGIPRVRKMIILCILFRISRKQNYREVPGGWMDAVRRCEAGERMDWAALIAANLVAQLDTIRTSGRGGLSYSTLLQCWFFDHFAAVAPAGGPHPITEGAPMVHRWQTRLRGIEDRAHVRRSVEATSLDLLTLPDYTAEPYRTVRWGSDDEAGGAGAPAGDDSSDGGDDGDSGDSGADPSRPAEAAGPSGTAGQAEGPSGAAEGEAGPSGAQGDVRGPVTRARRLRIVMGSAGARAGAIPTGRGTQAAEEVPEDEAPAAGGEPGGEDAVQPEDQAATAGTAEIRRLVEAVVREMFPQVYAEGQPPIQAGDEPRTAGAHREAFAPLVRARDMWAAESQEHATSLGQLQQERDDARRERDDARRERDELRGRAQAQEAQGGAGGDSESRTQLIIITERLRVTEEALRGERDRIQARYDQLVAQMVSRSSRSRTHTHTAATTPRRPRDEGSEAGSSRRTRRSLGGVWSPGEGSQRPGEGAPGAGPQQ